MPHARPDIIEKGTRAENHKGVNIPAITLTPAAWHVVTMLCRCPNEDVCGDRKKVLTWRIVHDFRV